MSNVLDTLLERGYIKQFTHEEETRESKVTIVQAGEQKCTEEIFIYKWQICAIIRN